MDTTDQLRSARARRCVLLVFRFMFASLLLDTAGIVPAAVPVCDVVLFIGVVVFMGAAPVADGVVRVAAVPVRAVSAALRVLSAAESAASRALSAADSSVRTTVPVSARGTALRLASAASCGVTPTVVELVDGVVVCAIAPVAATDSTALANKAEKMGCCISVLLRVKQKLETSAFQAVQKIWFAIAFSVVCSALAASVLPLRRGACIQKSGLFVGESPKRPRVLRLRRRAEPWPY